ncbi:unnamed protein product [Owenia fusiformis]|uniref:Uncharacterized protein n=1 Tax=Owenia fusiformis TaxID=6347 RepID=A0A8S4P5L2_OWEFU|nr:unnamed protein product [Owenia fusiformis]
MMSQLDISCGRERHAIYFDDYQNDLNNFSYVPHNIPGPGTDVEPFEEQYKGCQCAEICGQQCPCITRFGPTYQGSKILIHGLLQSQTMKPIYECNKECKCNTNCSNRVVQNGLQYKVSAFTTKWKGYGLKTLETIPKNAFVCEYAGEFLTHNEARRRTHALKHKTDSNYIITLKEHLGENILKTYIDPTNVGNVGRFMNHSCMPNLAMLPVRVDNSVPHLALFAIRDIEEGEELCYNYSGELYIVNEGDIDEDGETETVNMEQNTAKTNEDSASRDATNMVITSTNMDNPNSDGNDTIDDDKHLGASQKDDSKGVQSKEVCFDDQVKSIDVNRTDTISVDRKVCHCGTSACTGFLPYDASLFDDD